MNGTDHMSTPESPPTPQRNDVNVRYDADVVTSDIDRLTTVQFRERQYLMCWTKLADNPSGWAPCCDTVTQRSGPLKMHKRGFDHFCITFGLKRTEFRKAIVDLLIAAQR